MVLTVGLLFIMVYHVSSLLLFLHHDISLIQTFLSFLLFGSLVKNLARATLSRNTRARVAFKATATCVWYTRSLSVAVDGAGGLTEHTTMLHVMYMCCPFSLKVRRKHFTLATQRRRCSSLLCAGKLLKVVTVFPLYRYELSVDIFDLWGYALFSKKIYTMTSTKYTRL